MKIGIVSKLWEETSPYSVGGTGVAVGVLAEELVRRGHEVTLFATGDSETAARLISVREKPWSEHYSEPIELLHISQAFSMHKEFDVLDCHIEEKACHFAGLINTPTLINVTYGELGDEQRVYERYKHLRYVSISNAITNLLPQLSWVDTIYHGIDPNLFSYSDEHGEYLLFLGRVSPQKGPHVAIKVAQETGKKLIIAGKMTESDRPYLEAHVFPHIDDKHIVYAGVADFAKKCELLKNALALLHPIDYLEAFGLTLIESMACGTPVISFDNGAPREIIEEGKTGFVVDTEEKMIEAAARVPDLSRAACRKRVEDCFSARTMTDRYEALFEKTIKEASENKPRK